MASSTRQAQSGLASEHREQARRRRRPSRRQPEFETPAAAGAGVAYRKAPLEAVAETGLPAITFPETCEWTAEQALDGGYWPD
nr:DUF29 family protein [Roseiarcus fermentans]